MKGDFVIRTATLADRTEIRTLLEAAFGQPDEATLVGALVSAGEAVLELVAETNGRIIGHILFSRLTVEGGERGFRPVALAPLAVAPEHQRLGIGAALVEDAHNRLSEAGERLSIVLGDPAYYGRFGYAHARAGAFDSDYQCDALQALAWGDAPKRGRLVYPAPFAGM